MLRKAAFRIDTFKTSHAIALQKWLVDFSQIVSLYFFVQESVIYPQILSRIDSDDRTLIIELRKKTQPLIDELLEIHKGSLTFVSACQGRDDEKLLNFDTASLYLALQQLSKQVFRCVAELEIFFTWELDHVAPEIRSCMNRKESRALQRNAIMKILSQRVGEDLLGAYSHWVPSEVKELYFASVDRFKLIRLRGKEKKWMRTHKSLQKTLASRTL
ncbi:unnamed protein product [Chondrus crispus]|uniref:Uncharacterized protein n=1 Tax=Chondrus crispus TaxID=2769 RepID=R7QGQ1_CHOCR|nr:unnamed protein product [Chondrus crispus]CDF36928.1 unnamed protein product [Chondrus crispus]|eukprot:XP_005716747.1 unnamed protein product [Chondrus crispus]